MTAPLFPTIIVLQTVQDNLGFFKKVSYRFLKCLKCFQYTLDKSLFTRHQKNAAMFIWSGCIEYKVKRKQINNIYKSSYG